VREALGADELSARDPVNVDEHQPDLVDAILRDPPEDVGAELAIRFGHYPDRALRRSSSAVILMAQMLALLTQEKICDGDHDPDL
jgi:hypothetical protein